MHVVGFTSVMRQLPKNLISLRVKAFFTGGTTSGFITHTHTHTHTHIYIYIYMGHRRGHIRV